MICKYCGTNNRDNDAYCAYCGKPLNRGDSPMPDYPPHGEQPKNMIKILAIVLSIALVFAGGFLLLKGNLFGGDASIDGVVVDGDYEMEGDTYVFAVNETVVLDPQIKSSNQDVDLRYELEDNSVANVVKLDNKCSIVGMKPQQTNLNIYEGDKILKVIKIAFKNDLDSDGNVSNNTENNNATNNRGSSASRNRNNSSSSNNSSNSSSSGSSRQGSSSESIPLDDLTYFMSSYLNNYQDAMSCGQFSIISGQLTSSGPLYKQLKTAVPDTYNKGIIINLRSCDKVAAKQISNGVYSLTYTVDWEIYNPKEDTLRVQREYGDYIIQKSGSSYKLDRMENWEILSKQYI